jgi:hypothetical protein
MEQEVVSYVEILNDDAFARLVSEDVKNKVAPKQKQILLEPANWGRWKEALLFLAENLDNQLSEIDSDLDSDKARYLAMGETVLAREAELFYFNKKNKIVRFKFHVDRRIDEVISLIEKNEMPTDFLSIPQDPLIDFYKKAIINHRFLIYEYDLEETSIDRALWATLDGVWEFSKITAESL